MAIRRPAVICALMLLGLAESAWSADPPWRLVSADGKLSLAFGVLAQPQAEWLTTADGTDTVQNLLLRRVRFVLGGRITDRVTFFIDTDAPNLGKGQASGRKGEDAIFLQDLVITCAMSPTIMIDTGLLIAPVGHHAAQSATNLLGVDYGPYNFLHSEPTNSRTGRDYGIQARGYVANRHLEFRAGVFSGARLRGSTAPFRYVARVVWYPLEADTGFFYAGTALGARRVISLGASVDHQDDYTAGGLDVYVDHPVRGGRQNLTGQVGYTRYDGGLTFPQLSAEDVWLVEAGVMDKASRLGPFVQWTTRREQAAGTNESRLTGGVAYWIDGHRFNIKVGVGRLTRSGGPARTQVVVQGQVYVF